MNVMKTRHQNFTSFSSGEQYRRIAEHDGMSQLGRLIREYADSGQLLPDEYVLPIMQPKINSLIEEGYEYIALDGIPRTISQAEVLTNSKMPIIVFDIVGIEDSVCIERILKAPDRGNRPDDKNPGVIQRRMEGYHKHTRPVGDYFRTRYPHLYFPINGLFEPQGKAQVIENALGLVPQVRPLRENVGAYASV